MELLYSLRNGLKNTIFKLCCENKSTKYLIRGMTTKEVGFQWSSAPRRANSYEASGQWYDLM